MNLIIFIKVTIAQLAGTRAVARGLQRPYLTRRLLWIIAHDRKLKELENEMV
jgi:hypothetical protein